jgi:peptidoglycan/LPS O-acetylase OafA/YrhL
MNTASDTPQAITPSGLHISQLNSVRLIAILLIGMGYASTMPLGPGNPEMGHHLGYDPSWYGMQVIFFLSGLMAMRSVSAGRNGWQYLISRAKRTLPLLALYTAAVVIILFPLLCAAGARTLSSVPILAKYFIETVFLTHPGQPLPGLMDDAKYGCLAQGAIWTLRWGAAFHIGTAIGGSLGLFKNRTALLVLALLSTLIYAAAHYFAVIHQITSLEALMPGMRLGYIFLLGMAAFAWRDHIPAGLKFRFLGLALLGGGAWLSYNFSRWTPADEILMTLFWAYLALLGLQMNLSAMKNWPNLVLPTFLGVWPAAQLYVMAFPNMTSSGVVFASLTSALALAYLVRLGVVTLRERLQSGRKVAVKPA